jgi:hypothetical protein
MVPNPFTAPEKNDGSEWAVIQRDHSRWAEAEDRDLLNEKGVSRRVPQLRGASKSHTA